VTLTPKETRHVDDAELMLVRAGDLDLEDVVGESGGILVDNGATIGKPHELSCLR
jgi:hypothetical protein